MSKKEQPEFIDRILNPQKYPYLKNKDGSISTHEMAAEVDEDGNWFVFQIRFSEVIHAVAQLWFEEVMGNHGIIPLTL